MKKLKRSPVAQFIAVLLFLALAAGLVLMTLSFAYLGDLGALPSDYDNGWNSLLRRYSRPYATDVSRMHSDGTDIPQHEHLRYRIFDAEGNLVDKGNYDPGIEYAWHGHFDSYVHGEAQIMEKELVVECSLPAGDYVGELGNMLWWYKTCYNYRYHLMTGIIVCGLLLVAVWVFLLSAAGHRKGSEELKLSFIDRIPYDVFAAVCFFICFGGTYLVVNLPYEELYFCVMGAISALCIMGLVLLWSVSTAVRIKCRSLIKNTLCFMLLSFCLKIIRKVLKPVRAPLKKLLVFPLTAFKKLSLVWRGVLIFLGLLFVEFLLIAIVGGFNYHGCAPRNWLWFLERLLLFVPLMYVLICMKELRKGASEIASGNEKAIIDTKHLRWEFLRHGEDLNNIRMGLTKAVDERMKSERLKTELISNVSHDIKTPLTSIINYVDLLKKEEPENEKMREYIDVLSRQSDRLKKLTEDLVEATKASSGAIGVRLEECELNVLLDQTAGEYAEKLAVSQLELILDKGPERVVIMADGRHMWRILDNLMSNVCKYSLPRSRVYLSLEADDRQARIILRNISKERIGVKAEELTERFVRGDSSRNTEGSGLGLSIAESLTRLQGGDMQISLDGDLFKVCLSFPRK
ncbi:MAG: HAMP domain-containing histidine kinase [Oscillospiraceae bacterium]|nr:HAMP domain-containing histidine kinase [Oscillospiraceae bacterium]